VTRAGVARTGARKARLAAAISPMAAACALFAAACAPAAAPDASPIATLHTRACGKCHAPPEPGSHSRAQLTDAFGRHQRRTHLTKDQWAAMLDYLAAPDGATSAQKD